MKFPKKWMKDVVVVQFKDNGYAGKDLILPPGIKHAQKLCEAEVIALGVKCSIKDDIKIGSIVWCDSYLGTRRTFDDRGEVVTFDTEDIYGVTIK
jgi:co-chaperonin GroES (HSP10)